MVPISLLVPSTSTQYDEQRDTRQQNCARHEEMAIGQNSFEVTQWPNAPVQALNHVIANVDVTVSSAHSLCQRAPRLIAAWNSRPADEGLPTRCSRRVEGAITFCAC